MNALAENIAPAPGYFAGFQLKQECPGTQTDLNYQTHTSLLLPHFLINVSHSGLCGYASFEGSGFGAEK